MCFSFLVFNALVFMLRDSGLVLRFYTVCAIHEAGHLAALGITGGNVRSVELSASGIRIEVKKGGIVRTLSSLFVLLAGPAANIIMYLALRLAGCGGSFLLLNLAAAAYNMLPYDSLDGGAAVSLFTAGTTYERTAEAVLFTVKLLITAAAGAAVWLYGKAALPLLIGSAALFIGDMHRSP